MYPPRPHRPSVVIGLFPFRVGGPYCASLVKRLSSQSTWPCPSCFIRSRRVRTTACVAQKPSFSIPDQDSGIWGPSRLLLPRACQRRSRTHPLTANTHVLNPVDVGLLGVVIISEALPWKPWIASSTTSQQHVFQGSKTLKAGTEVVCKWFHLNKRRNLGALGSVNHSDG